MLRFAIVLVTMVALAASACGGEPLHVQENRQVAPLWMTELDTPGCTVMAQTSAEHQVGLLLHPYDSGLVIAVADGAPLCIGEEAAALRALGIHRGLPPARQMMGSPPAPPEDDPVPIKDEEQDDQQGGESTPHRDGLDRVEIPNFNETVSDDPVPIKDGKSLHLWEENSGSGSTVQQ